MIERYCIDTDEIALREWDGTMPVDELMTTLVDRYEIDNFCGSFVHLLGIL